MGTFSLLSSSAVCQELGARIRQLRLARNITQQQLAQMTQASQSSIRRAESLGQATLELSVRIAQALQATAQFEPLFLAPSESIADLERVAAVATRRRARLPASKFLANPTTAMRPEPSV